MIRVELLVHLRLGDVHAKVLFTSREEGGLGLGVVMFWLRGRSPCLSQQHEGERFEARDVSSEFFDLAAILRRLEDLVLPCGGFGEYQNVQSFSLQSVFIIQSIGVTVL